MTGRDTYAGDLQRRMREVYEIEDDDARARAAAAFMDEVRQTENGPIDVGWLCGEFDRDTMNAMLELFDVEHPISGKRALATSVEAVLAGALVMVKGYDETRHLIEIGRLVEGPRG